MSQNEDIFEVVDGEVRIYADKIKQAYEQGFLHAPGVLVLYIRIFKPELPIKNVDAFCQEYGMPRTTFYRAVKTLQENGEYPATDKASPEKVVRDRLQSQIGGLAEVTTPVGRIDLLTEAEIIEVKHVSDWKAAMGQVLAYSAYFPSHQKRLHLFHNKNSKPLADSWEAQRICSELGILITFEEEQ